MRKPLLTASGAAAIAFNVDGIDGFRM